MFGGYARGCCCVNWSFHYCFPLVEAPLRGCEVNNALKFFFKIAKFFPIQYYTYSQYSNPLRAQKFRNNNAFVENFATHLWFFIALFFLFLTHFEAGAYWGCALHFWHALSYFGLLLSLLSSLHWRFCSSTYGPVVVVVLNWVLAAKAPSVFSIGGLYIV